MIEALFGLLGNLVVAGAFTLMGRSQSKERAEQAKERQFLLNAALSGNSYEFAVRQAATTEKRFVGEESEPEIMPEGL